MPQSLSRLIMHLKPYWLDDAAAVAGIELNKIILFPLAGPAVFYDKDAAGLTAALGAAQAGEIVMIHGPCTLTDDFTVPSEVVLLALARHEITLAGTVYLGESSVIYNLAITATANDANDLYGVVGPTAGTGYIYYCDISAVQSGAGNAYAIGATRGLTTNNGDLVIRHSKLHGESTSGDGYAGRSTRGRIYSRHNDYYGSTDRWVQS